jgi:hypothetical protein
VYENLSAWVQGDANGTWPTSSLLPTTSYRLDFNEAGISRSGQIIRTVGTWITVPRCVKVTYVGGYSTAEINASFGHLKMAVLEAIGWWWGKALMRSNGVRSNMQSALSLTIRDFSVSFGNPDGGGQASGSWAQNVLGPSTLQLLMKFVNLTQYFR